MECVHNHWRQNCTGVPIWLVPLLIICLISAIDITQWCVCCVILGRAVRLNYWTKGRGVHRSKTTCKEAIVEWVLYRHSTMIRITDIWTRPLRNTTLYRPDRGYVILCEICCMGLKAQQEVVWIFVKDSITSVVETVRWLALIFGVFHYDIFVSLI